MRLFRLTAALAAILLGARARAALDVRPAADGFEILRDGSPVAFARIDLGKDVRPGHRTSFAEDARLGRVWNVWCEEERLRYRVECAVRADGAVELTLSGEMKCDSPHRTRRLVLRVPKGVLAGREVRYYRDKASRHRTGDVPFVGTGADAFREPCECRFAAFSGLTFDFCPMGSAYVEDSHGPCSVDGRWETGRTDSGDVTFTGGAVVDRPFGGWAAAKLVVREGSFADFDRFHFQRYFHYALPLGAMHQLSFGASRTGGGFSDGEVSFSAMRGYGWWHEDAGDRRSWRKILGVETHTGHPEGVYYSCISGTGETDHGPTAYRFAKLPDGHYIVTVGAGNFTGVTNRFDILVNGETLARDVTVPARHARTISRVFRVRGGELDIRLTGRYILSTIGVQGLLADGEDFSLSRNFWLTDGYEPTHLYRNADNADRKPFAVADETYFLPVPGEEAAGPLRKLSRERDIPDRSQPSLAWMDAPRVLPLNFNWENFAEFGDRPLFERKFDELAAGKGVNLVMLSGLLSRHTYPAHEDRIVRTIAQTVDSLHARGIRVIDHHDITLCWNEGSGFRVLAERLGEMSRTVGSMLPSFQFCISNPVFNERQYAYLRRLVAEAHVDGFQLDEVEYWACGCVCAACRGSSRSEGPGADRLRPVVRRRAPEHAGNLAARPLSAEMLRRAGRVRRLRVGQTRVAAKAQGGSRRVGLDGPGAGGGARDALARGGWRARRPFPERHRRAEAGPRGISGEGRGEGRVPGSVRGHRRDTAGRRRGSRRGDESRFRGRGFARVPAGTGRTPDVRPAQGADAGLHARPRLLAQGASFKVRKRRKERKK